MPNSHDPWWMIIGASVLGAVVGAISGMLIRRWWDGLGGAQARDTVRRWWRSGLAAPPSTITVRNRDGTTEAMRPVRASGLHLVVEPCAAGKMRTWRTIGAADAADVGEYWRVWKYYGGRSSGWIDEDGDDFVPGERA